MKYQDHCEESLRLFGNPYSELHLWLDAFAGSEEYGFKHRRKRHHLAGMQEAIALFGTEVEAPARQHIISDLKEEGWNINDHFPIDEQDYISMGLF